MPGPSTATPGRPSPLRLVLDTNVWLDVLVFQDRGVAALTAAIERGRVEVFTDDVCSGELRRVLGYGFGRFTLDEAAGASCWQRFLAHVRFWSEARRDAGARSLPRCADPDDQAFLELADACGAAALVTRDRALLRLGGARYALGFAIVPPAWTANLADGAAGR
jgi:predicted nucleic acid-binding protein